jgi:transposase
MKQFKECHQYQMNCLPPSLDEMIDPKHLVRIIDKLINKITPSSIEDNFSGGGTPSYHPRMMLKVIIYAYCQKVYSCRRIAQKLREDIPFMWLAGSSRPDFNTVNRFRSQYLQEVLPKVFTEVLDFLHENHYIQFENYFVDGTKLEANAGQYSAVWKKNTERYKEGVKSRVRELFKEIDRINEVENLEYGDKDLLERGEQAEVTIKDIEDAAKKINEKIEEETDKKRTRFLKSRNNKLEQERQKLEKYETQEKILGERNSYSRTDKDATFMRLKDDRLRAAYNVQISTENQFIVHYSVSKKATDISCFKDHIDKLATRGKKYLPKTYTGDCGYGSEENYACLEDYNIESYLKYNTFHYEQTSKFKKNQYYRDNMPYDQNTDTYTCPAGKKIKYLENREKKTTTGYQICLKYYECEDCSNCSHKGLCTKAVKNRGIQISPILEAYKEKMRIKLNSEKGLLLRRKRSCDVETSFGDIKGNQEFTRFQLRGNEKVEHELGMVSLSHNIRKLHALMN